MPKRRLVSPNEIVEQRMRWLWADRIPLGAITILDGDPSAGKSTITYDLAARVTIGQPMPECDRAIAPGGVVLLQAEDNVAEIVVPRLRALGTDMDRIKLLDRKLFAQQPLVLPDDLPLVEAAVGDVQAKLVVIDPLTAFLTGNTNSDTSIRKVLGPVAAFAERCDLAVVIVRHLRKAGGRNPLYGGSGSIGIIAAARSGLLVGRDPASDDKFQHVLAQSKGNLSGAESLCYRTVRHDDGTVAVEWLGPSRHTATDLADATAAADEHSAIREAQYVLYSILAEGKIPASDVIRLGRLAGVCERTLKRAKRELGVRSWKSGSGPGSRWFWQLPDDQELLRPFKDRDIGDLMDQLIYGEDGPAQDGNDEKRHPDLPGEGQDDDDGDEEGAWEVQ